MPRRPSGVEPRPDAAARQVERDRDPGDQQRERDPDDALARVRFAISSVYSLNVAEARRSGRSTRRDVARRRPGRRAIAAGGPRIGWPSGVRPGDAVREAIRIAVAVGGLVEQQLEADVPARDADGRRTAGRPRRRSSAPAPSHSGRPAASRTTRCGAGPKPFWWNV